MIDYLIHFYKRGTQPFRSLSALPDCEAMKIMQDLYIEGSVFWERFKDPSQYRQARQQIEGWLRREVIATGGVPELPYPIYMILGRSRWLQTAADEITLATTAEIQVPLALFRETEISFTYPDSMVSYLIANEKDSHYYLPEYHGKLFTLPEISSIVESNGLPGESWGANLPRHLANYIEAQVWSQKPLLEYYKKP
jgi:hypothetical protein